MGRAVFGCIINVCLLTITGVIIIFKQGYDTIFLSKDEPIKIISLLMDMLVKLCFFRTFSGCRGKIAHFKIN